MLGSTPLVKTGTSNGLVVWDNAGAPLPVKFGSGDAKVGVVIALGGAQHDDLRRSRWSTCYDTGAAKLASGLPVAGHRPHARLVRRGQRRAAERPRSCATSTLVPGTCADPYFSSAVATCTFGVRARVDFGAAGDPVAAVGAKLDRQGRRDDLPAHL